MTFKGRARMKEPQNLFWSIESAEGADLKGIPSDIPRRHYFGRVVALGNRKPIAKYDLRHRRYLGPTSMDVEMGRANYNSSIRLHLLFKSPPSELCQFNFFYKTRVCMQRFKPAEVHRSMYGILQKYATRVRNTSSR